LTNKINKFIDISKSIDDILVKKHHIENCLEQRRCVNINDLGQLLNNVLQLDRLKQLIERIPAIKAYIRLHPINTFNAFKAFQLECKPNIYIYIYIYMCCSTKRNIAFVFVSYDDQVEFNQYDLKFLRDLKLLNQIWYKQYLLSRTSNIDVNIAEPVVDDEYQQDKQYEQDFRSTFDDELEWTSLNNILTDKQVPTNNRIEQHRSIFM
jgi:hypothetical protein